MAWRCPECGYNITEAFGPVDRCPACGANPAEANPAAAVVEDPRGVTDEPVAERGRESGSSSAAWLSRRYQDAYAVARGIIAHGGMLKTLGILVGVALSLGGVASFSAGNQWVAVGILGIVVGVVVGMSLFALGVFVSGQGQLILATLDVAVNSSPLLPDHEKAAIMK